MSYLLKISENELKNQIVYRTIQILKSNGDSLRLDFPIELSADGSYKFMISGTQLKNFKKNVYAKNDFDSLEEEQKNATAQDIIEYISLFDRNNKKLASKIL